MEDSIKKTALYVMTEQCYKEYFVQYNFFNLLCLKALVSKCLGYAVIFGSLTVKVPQILKIWNNHSAQGVSLVNSLTDLYAITITSSYSFVSQFPFSAYGEGLFMGIQTLIITEQVLYYQYSSAISAGFIPIYSAIVYSTTSGLIPIDILWTLQATTLPILLFGKLTQAFANYKNKGTGQLSAVTCALMLFGSTSRIFTSVVETGDKILLLAYLLSTIGNAIIVLQFIIYRKSTPPTKSSKKKKSSKKSE